jgi:hypothetical protein
MSAVVTAPGAASAAPAGSAKEPAVFAKLRAEGFKIVTPTPGKAAGRYGIATDADPPPLGWPWRVVNIHSGKCLTVLNVSTADNAQAVQYDCENDWPYNEEWTFTFAGYDIDGLPTYKIENGHSHKCLTIYGASTANTANAVQYTCDNSAPYNERWLVWHHELSNTYMFINQHSARCLTIQNASQANNAAAVQYTCDYDVWPLNERWRITAQV